jgi:hypothetical protein
MRSNFDQVQHEQLLAALRSDSQSSRIYATRLLAEFGDQRASEPLRKALHRAAGNRPHRNTRRLGVIALCAIAGLPLLVIVLLGLLAADGRPRFFLLNPLSRTFFVLARCVLLSRTERLECLRVLEALQAIALRSPGRITHEVRSDLECVSTDLIQQSRAARRVARELISGVPSGGSPAVGLPVPAGASLPELQALPVPSDAPADVLPVCTEGGRHGS